MRRNHTIKGSKNAGQEALTAATHGGRSGRPVATAEGKLLLQSSRKIFQHAEQCVILDILVAEGEAVKAGQVLMRLENRVPYRAIGPQVVYAAIGIMCSS